MLLAVGAVALGNTSLAAQTLVYGQTYKLENTWMTRTAYLDVNGQGCQGNYLCVSTTTDAGRKQSNTSDWILLSASGKQPGQTVANGDIIMLKNPWMKASYLGTQGYSKDFKCPGYLCVSTFLDAGDNGSTSWQVKGDPKLGSAVQLVGQWNKATAGHLDMDGLKASDDGYNVATTTDPARIKGASTMWKFVSTTKAAATSNTLTAGQSLKAGEKLVSSNGAYMLVMQADDGNLCVYKNDNGKQGAFVWGSMKYGFKNAQLDMQTDGNLVVYSGKDSKWSSETHPFYDAKFKDSSNKPAKLVLENDGKLKLYTAANKVVWTS